MRKRVLLGLIVFLVSLPVAFFSFVYFSRAAAVPANIVVDTRRIVAPLQPNWKAIAQGGEERGRMLGNIIPQLTDLAPRYIRIDHIYDYYDVVSRDKNGNLIFDFSRLDETVCDILTTGAKPFFSLSYMPLVLSADGTAIAEPKDWEEWATVVEQTIERYSGRGTVMCGGAIGHALTNVYYEVWNEPDLEQFGKWSIYGGSKDYRLLYFYSAKGAERAAQVNTFSLGGPAITAPYKNWFKQFLSYARENNLRVDFLSWHRYTKSPDVFTTDINDIYSWISQNEFGKYSSLPKVISEWGYDSTVNGAADTDLGAAYTVAVARNLSDNQLELAFSFEARDGFNPSWGIMTREGKKKPRYFALSALNSLGRYRLSLEGEGTYVRGIATSNSPTESILILTNYDQMSSNVENVPFAFTGLPDGAYEVTTSYLNGTSIISTAQSVAGRLERTILMTPNSVITVKLQKK